MSMNRHCHPSTRHHSDVKDGYVQSLNRAAGFKSTFASKFVMLAAFVTGLIQASPSLVAQPARPNPSRPGSGLPTPRVEENKIDPDKLPDWFRPPAERLAIMDLEQPLATKEELAKLKREAVTAFRPALKDCDTSPQGQKVVEGAIRYKFAEMTLKEKLGDLPTLRKQFIGDFASIGGVGARPGQVQAMTQLVGKEVLKQIPELLKNNFYVRLNAVYILCEMNYSPAYELLLQVMQAKDIHVDEENGQPEALKIVASMGLVRILRFANPSVKERTTIALAAIETLKDPSAHFWCQIRLIEALRYCEIAGVDPGDNNRPIVVECLLSIVNDANRPWKVRTRACYALGRVTIPKSAKIEDVVTAITDCALKISNEAAASPNNLDWKYCFFNLYAAFHTVDEPKEKDLDTEKKGPGGLLVRSKAASQAAYNVIVPIVADILGGKAPDAGNLQKLNQFVRTRQPDAAQAGAAK